MHIDEQLKSLSPRTYMVGLNTFDIVEAHNPEDAVRVCDTADKGAVAISISQIARAATVFTELESKGMTPVAIGEDLSKARKWLIHAVDAGNKVQMILAMANSYDQIESWADAGGWDLLSAQSEQTLQRLLDLASQVSARAKA